MLPEIVYNIKKKLGCIFVENHNPESILLKRVLTIGLLYVMRVSQEEQGQAPVENDTENCIGGTSVGDAEKAGRKLDSVQSLENRKFYKTEDLKCQFILESFQLDENKILNAIEKLKMQ